MSQQPSSGQEPRKPWVRRHKILTGLGALTAFVIIVSVAAHGGTTTPTTSPGTPTPDVTLKASPSSAPTTPPPSPAPVRTLLSFSGSGIKNSPPFQVQGPVTVKYSYSCSSFGSSGNFIADLVYGAEASLSGDDQSIANELGSGGSQTTVIYPQDPGQNYHLTVTSECSWSITVSGT